MAVRPPSTFDHPAPHSSESDRSLKRPRHTCSDKQGLGPCKDISVSQILKRWQARPPPTPEDLENILLKDVGEDPEADLMAFMSYDTLPSRVAWSSLSRDDYDHVKEVFARRGVPICRDTCKADIIKFKEALLARDEDMF